ncbi:mechanosensitive ion channel family protein [Paraburkholderia hospita]|uniref:Mechanosensitive ion channel protein MscS n=1 Tax=Paraburkholderia hospita TaxID=169430 RepID=A0AAN1MLF4_9BURK|nr:mechanosensitive ion channel domain-containing protein [Paraburkholderia hospita]AUT71392.1 mechanosensitive ion channel protein MscS [Paraburkholderia hospita]EIM94291.1 small conductance mechanosensitive channel ion channel [Paraburkholderia hospita]OUL68517.1 mechanosensitive ion channel protein MscS [Paraburkholderia hospita]OUL74350.1 mechanosensitive ion channel protein MscS [Paraburkholderia hospita]SEI02585.1 small conductance mechanosensitive channel [Paraburkholderia hospita]
MNPFTRRQFIRVQHFASERTRVSVRVGASSAGVGRGVPSFRTWPVVACFLIALGACIIPADAAPLPAALQSIVNTATGAASPVPASQPASASSPASEAELARSLDTLIDTLDNDTKRNALVTQLKGLRDASQHGAPAAPAPAKGDLLGAIASGLASVETNLNEGRTPLRFWATRFSGAASELRAILTGSRGESFGKLLIGMAVTLAGWGGCAGLLVYLQRRICARYGWHVALAPNPTSLDMLGFALRQTGPWIVAFVAVLLFVQAMPDALGRTLGLVIAYAIVVGSIFSAICMIVFSVFGTAHRRVAVQQLLTQGLWPLFAIGACGALGDATANPEVIRLLGVNLAGLVSSFANMVAAILIGYFALAYRRPVTHLISNRAYSRRRDHKFATEALDILASLWHIPILLIAIASVVAIIDGRGEEGNVLQPSLLSALFLVLTLFVSALLLHLTRRKDSRVQRRAPHLMRLLRFATMLFLLAIWLAYIRFELVLWSGPIARLIRHNAMTPGFRHALIAIIATVFGAWFMWILIDTVILETLGPSNSRNKTLDPGVRARTMLPLVRNAIFVTVVSLAAIIGAASLGINLTPLLAGAGVIGLAVGFGAKSLVTDLITGLFIIVEETISVGDWIEVDGAHAGTVMDLTIRTVRLRDGQGAVHTIPFSQIKIVKNLSRDFANAVFEVRLPFSADIDEVTRMIVQVGADLTEDSRFRDEILGPIEVWGLDRFDANWIVVKGQIKTRPLQQWSVARAFNARLKLVMDRAGIEIPVPQMQLHASPKERNL